VPQIPHYLTWDRTRAVAVRSRRLTAWVMARTSDFTYSSPSSSETSHCLRATGCYNTKYLILHISMGFSNIRVSAFSLRHTLGSEAHLRKRKSNSRLPRMCMGHVLLRYCHWLDVQTGNYTTELYAVCIQ
jgi:hypothetical protein